MSENKNVEKKSSKDPKKKKKKVEKVLLLLPEAKGASLQEIDRLTAPLIGQSPRPRVHWFVGKENVYDSEVIMELLEQRELSHTFSPALGARLDQDEIYHLVAFLESAVYDHQAGAERHVFYRQWQRDLLATGHRPPRETDVYLKITEDTPPLFPPRKPGFWQKLWEKINGPRPPEPPPVQTVFEPHPPALGNPLFDPTTMPVPKWTTRERLLNGGWFGMGLPTTTQQQETEVIERAIAEARQAEPVTRKLPARLLICGWYGTETLGDKAILGGVILAARKQFPDLIVDVASLEPYVTFETARQMPDLKIERVLTLGESLAAIMNGEYGILAVVGPLMSPIRRCIHLFELFAAAKISGTKSVVAACGVGPIQIVHRNAAIKHILELADAVVLRDSASAERARTVLGVERDCDSAPDAAFLWIRRQMEFPAKKNPRRILLGLRDWPLDEFASGIDRSEAIAIKDRFEAELATMLRELTHIDPSLEIVPFCMHKYIVGGDDRKFYRRLLKDFPEILARLDQRHRTPAEDLRMFASSRAVVAMRFHSVAFSVATETPFLAIDYTRGGKIAGLLDDVRAPGLIRGIADFDGSEAANSLLTVSSPPRDPAEMADAVENALGRAFAKVFQPS